MGLTNTFYLTNNDSSEVAVLTSQKVMQSVDFDFNGTDWIATVRETSNSLNLGSNGYFWFKYGDQTSYNYDVLETGAGYSLLFNNGNNGNDIIIAIDVAPVPIPGAALLLASGMLGLGWLKRRSEA
jgi:hypothetical protein